MTSLPKLDHAVINVGYEMDQAAELFAALGFQLTKRGYHSLGSINHLMMFGSDYLELIGLPSETADKPAGRPDIAKAPAGLNGLVFKTEDATATHAHLDRLGMTKAPPKSFTRPVEIDGGEVDASFTTAHLTGGLVPGGRVYFCEHHTPDVVWREEWQQHDNGAKAITEFVIATEQPDVESETLGRILNTDALPEGNGASIPLQAAKISVMAVGDYQERYGSLACPMGDRQSIFGALQIQTDDLNKIRRILNAMKIQAPFDDQGDRLLVRESNFNSLFEFIE
ncbi:MAG: VOC family protein [Proteobacteria bacterium]|nr:VOC family protein [Pseudomonadota bacterium]